MIEYERAGAVAVIRIDRPECRNVIGREVSATTAQDWGLVARLVDDGDALDEAIALVEWIVEFPQETLRLHRAASTRGLASIVRGTGFRRRLFTTRVESQADDVEATASAGR